MSDARGGDCWLFAGRRFRHVLYPRKPFDRLRPSERRCRQQCDVLDFRCRQTFVKSSTRMRMHGAARVGPDRQRKMDQSLASSIQRTRLVEGGPQLLEGGPHVGMLLRDLLRGQRQVNLRVLGEIGRC